MRSFSRGIRSAAAPAPAAGQFRADDPREIPRAGGRRGRVPCPEEPDALGLGLAARDGVDTDDQRDVIDWLATPAAYGPGVTDVERVDTHAAIVFLAGDGAWKLKRAVRYDYLDYSTPDRRRACCEAELARNVRLAPSIYRRVVAVTREAAGGLAIGGAGAPVDWLVAMRRFDSEALCDRLAARGALPLEAMPALAREVAAMHATAGHRVDHGGGRPRPAVHPRLAGANRAVLAMDAQQAPALDQERLELFDPGRGQVAEARGHWDQAGRRDAQSAMESPLLMSTRTSPSIMKVGDTWIPFCRAYLQCHLISRSRSGIAKAAASSRPL